MDLHLEGILETLLVGAIAGMLVLSVLFFFMGHALRIEVVSRFFQFLIYEDEDERQDKGDPINLPLSSAPEPARRPVPSHFVLVVLTALLYGAGVVVESWSHTDQDGHDAAMKLKAFDSVVHGRLASGAYPEPGLAHFVADYDACHLTHTNAAAVGSRDLRNLEAERVRGNDLSPCRQIDVRVAEFYHNAKNTVFQQKSYNEELINLQSRINFVRAVYEILRWLTVELGLVALIAGLAELFHWLKYKRKKPWAQRLSSRIPAFAVPFAHHLKKLAALRCLLMGIALAGFTYASGKACDECNIQFDKRVYGYFLALGDGHAGREVAAAGEEDEGESADAPDGKATSPAHPHDITPRSPYFVFTTSGDTPGQHLEPSAVRKLGDGSRVIVANDADKDGQQMFWLFDVVGNRLVHPERVCTKGAKNGSTDAFSSVRGVQAMYVSDPVDGKVDVLVAPTFENDGQKRLVRFSLDPERRAANGEMGWCTPIVGAATTELIPDPCAALNDQQTVGCRIEGMTSGDIKKELLFGVHDRRTVPPGGKGDPVLKPTVAIVQITRTDGSGWSAPRRIFATDELDDGCSQQSGISDLSLRPNGLLYVLTSVDLHDTATCSDRERAPLPEVAQVRGALWRLDRTKDEGLRLLYRFAHKPTGITDIGDGSLLLVFDDEGQRKSPIWAPRTFALRQNQSVFSVLPAAAEPRGPAPGVKPGSLVSEALAGAK